ncbi:MAG: glycosyltransferase [Prevotella sp.]|nr:glycosyltransferase [Prevotella sp.]
MTIVFASNFFNHHEKFLCDELYKLTDGNFRFIQTEPITEERKKLGWGLDLKEISYCMTSYEHSDSFQESLRIINECDVLIIGSAVNKYILQRIKQNKLSFFYAESQFKKGFWHFFYPPTFLSLLNRYIIPSMKSNVYMLCASAFTAIDTYKIHAFRNKCFRWGHFIEVSDSVPMSVTDKLSDTELKHHKDVSILWAGRLIGLKHPDMAVRAAKTLRDKGIPFTMNIIGTGELESEIRKMIEDYQLNDCVNMLGAMKPHEVRQYMEQADVFLFTSGRMEGWGAVLAESMVSGCAVIADSAIGSAPFLVDHDKNGLLYEEGSYENFEKQVVELISDVPRIKRLGNAACSSIRNLWSPSVAAQRFYQLCTELLNNQKVTLYKDGPISKAPLINRDWFTDKY